MTLKKTLARTVTAAAIVIFGFQSGAVAAGAAKPKPTATPKSRPTGRLIVQRAANFGNDLVLQVWIDGRKVANVPRNQHYGEVISAGRHKLTILALPNTQSRRASSIRISVSAGKVYIYTAGWVRDRLVLQSSTAYVPTQAVKPLGQKEAQAKRHGFWPFGR